MLLYVSMQLKSKLKYRLLAKLTTDWSTTWIYHSLYWV